MEIEIANWELMRALWAFAVEKHQLHFCFMRLFIWFVHSIRAARQLHAKNMLIFRDILIWWRCFCYWRSKWEMIASYQINNSNWCLRKMDLFQIIGELFEVRRKKHFSSCRFFVVIPLELIWIAVDGDDEWNQHHFQPCPTAFSSERILNCFD